MKGKGKWAGSNHQVTDANKKGSLCLVRGFLESVFLEFAKL